MLVSVPEQQEREKSDATDQPNQAQSQDDKNQQTVERFADELEDHSD